MKRRLTTLPSLLPALVASALVYQPITGNYFHIDDFINLQSIVNDPPLRFLLQPVSGHVLVLRNTLFYAFYRAFGTQVAYYFWIVLLTHLVNVGLLFAVIRRLTGSPPLACFGATLWGVAPLNEGSLGWYSVYGHVLAGSFVLYLLYRVAQRLDRPGSLTGAETLRWCGLLLLASVTFGVGMGIALVFPAVVFLLFAPSRMSHRGRLLLLAFPPVLLAGYWALHHGYALAYPHASKSNLALLLAMLTASWLNVIGMLAHMLAAGVAGLAGSFWLPPQTYPSPGAYTIVSVFVALFVVALVRAPSPTRRLLLALAIMVVGTYAVIAAGRAWYYAGQLDVRTYGAGIARYHYIGPSLLCIILCLLLGQLAVRPAGRNALLLTWLALVAAGYARSGWRIDHFARDRQITQGTLGAIQQAIDRSPPGQTVYIPNQTFRPAFFQADFAGWAAVFTIFFPIDVGRPVYFLEPDPAIRNLAYPGSRLATVLVSPPGGVLSSP